MRVRVSSSPLDSVALVLSPHAYLLGYGLVLPRARGERLYHMYGVNVSCPWARFLITVLQTRPGQRAGPLQLQRNKYREHQSANARGRMNVPPRENRQKRYSRASSQPTTPHGAPLKKPSLGVGGRPRRRVMRPTMSTHTCRRAAGRRLRCANGHPSPPRWRRHRPLRSHRRHRRCSSLLRRCSTR